MADYRLASLTAKSTPPVPRRRIMQREPSNAETRRPHISPPIINQLPPDRIRRIQHCTGSTEYRNGSTEIHWTDPSWAAEGSKKKVKNKKPSCQGRPNNRLLPNRTQESYMPHFRIPESELNIPPPDYPGLEYPPVFEPGTYTLDASTLLPRTPKSKP